MNKYRYLLKNVGVLTIGNFSSKILVFLMVPIYTSALSTSDYGIYDLTFATIQILMPLLTLSIIDSVMRFIMDKTTAKEDVAFIGLKFISISIMLAGVMLMIFQHINLFSGIQKYEILIFLYYIFYVLNQYGIQFAKGMECVTDMVVANILGSAFMFLLNILFLLLIDWGLRGFFIANILGQAIPAIYFGIRLKLWRYIHQGKADKVLQKEMLAFSSPLIINAMGLSANRYLGRYIVAAICGISANGLLSVAFKISDVLNVLYGVFMQAWIISAVKEYETDGYKNFCTTTFLYFNALSCFLCCGLIFFTKPVAGIIFAEDFFVAWKYVPFLLISTTLNGVAGFIGQILAAQKNSNVMAKSAIYGFLVNVIMCIMLTYFVGIQGAAIASVLASYVFYCVRKYAVGDLLNDSINKRIVMSWVVLCIQAVIEIYAGLYLIQLVLIAVQIILYRNCIWNIFNKAIKHIGGTA